MKERYCFGVDIGGTTIKIGLFTNEGMLLEKWEIPTRKEQSGKEILPDLAAALQQKGKEKQFSKEEVLGIGVGVPGPVMPNGEVLHCVNLGWGKVEFRKELQRLTGIETIVVQNDANVAALGEMWKGGAQGYETLVMLTLGTGVGGGIIYRGEILNGSSGAAGEVGHITVSTKEKEACNCGKCGCLEQFASATGIVREAKRMLQQTQEQTILEVEDLSAKQIFDAARQKDKIAMKLVEQLGMYLGLVSAQIAATIDPEVFVIGGGVSNAGEILLDAIRAPYDSYVMPALRGKPFVLAQLGNDAGIYGAVKLIFAEKGEK